MHQRITGRERERKGGKDTIEPQVFSPALPLTLPIPPSLPSQFHPLPVGLERQRGGAVGLGGIVRGEGIGHLRIFQIDESTREQTVSHQ